VFDTDAIVTEPDRGRTQDAPNAIDVTSRSGVTVASEVLFGQLVLSECLRCVAKQYFDSESPRAASALREKERRVLAVPLRGGARR
jgi:hypothetical protein